MGVHVDCLVLALHAKDIAPMDFLSMPLRELSTRRQVPHFHTCRRYMLLAWF